MLNDYKMLKVSLLRSLVDFVLVIASRFSQRVIVTRFSRLRPSRLRLSQWVERLNDIAAKQCRLNREAMTKRRSRD